MNEVSPQAFAKQLPVRFAEALQARFAGHVVAVILYGSWLRGARDTILDFYVLLDDYQALPGTAARLANRLLPPNVYNLIIEVDGLSCTAKYATLSVGHFEHAIERDFHSYFWARFAQPIVVISARDTHIRARIAAACERAAARMIAETSATFSAEFSTSQLWQRAFSLTYSCELRSENVAKSAELVDYHMPHLQITTKRLSAACGLTEVADQRWAINGTQYSHRVINARWSSRRLLGKVLSMMRLLKAALTFNQPLEYILWKVERHTGVHEDATVRQLRHPLLFSWPLLWRIYRRGGFR